MSIQVLMLLLRCPAILLLLLLALLLAQNYSQLFRFFVLYESRYLSAIRSLSRCLTSLQHSRRNVLRPISVCYRFGMCFKVMLKVMLLILGNEISLLLSDCMDMG